MVRDLLRVTQVLLVDLKQEVTSLHLALCCALRLFNCWKQFHRCCAELNILTAPSTCIPALTAGEAAHWCASFLTHRLYFVRFSSVLFSNDHRDPRELMCVAAVFFRIMVYTK